MSAEAPAAPHERRPPVIWFLAWAAVGIGLALGVSALGILTVPLALLGGILLAVRHHGGRSVLGILVGAGLLSLYVAYVQRKGPGTVYWHTATASGSDQYLDPRPWLVAGLLLVAVGIVAFFWRRRAAPSAH